MSIYVGDLQFVQNLSKLGISFKLKDILVGGMGNVNKYFCEVSDFKEIFNKFYTVIKIYPVKVICAGSGEEINNIYYFLVCIGWP